MFLGSPTRANSSVIYEETPPSKMVILKSPHRVLEAEADPETEPGFDTESEYGTARTTTTMTDRSNSCIVVTILHAASLKNALDFMRSGCSELSLVFTAQHLTIYSANSDKSVMASLQIDERRCKDYKFVALDENDERIEQVTLRFDSDRFYSPFKAVKGNETICMYYDDYRNAMVITKDVNHDYSNNLSYIPAVATYQVPDVAFDDYQTVPLRLGVDEFSDYCQSVNNHSSKLMELKVRRRVIMGAGRDSNNVEVCRHTFSPGLFEGSHEETDDEEDYEEQALIAELAELSKVSITLEDPVGTTIIRLPNPVVKSFAKFKKMACPGGIMHFNLEEDAPLRMEFQVGSYGTINVYAKVE